MTRIGLVPPLSDVNAQYFIALVRHQAAASHSLTVLDFGCGRGEVVAALRDEGIDAYGAEIFYGGASFEGVREGRLFRDGHLRAIDESGRLPFDNATFDLVISNQVLEHVDDLEAVIAEIHRVLKPAGRAYHHFPSLEVLREGHIGIPLAHRFAPGQARYRYTLALRRAGLGTHKKPSESAPAWTVRKLAYLDNFTRYRPYSEIIRVITPHFEVAHSEIDYCRFRAGDRPILRRLLAAAPLVGPSQRLFRRLAFMALDLRAR